MKIIGKQPSREKCAESGWFAWDYLLDEPVEREFILKLRPLGGFTYLDMLKQPFFKEFRVMIISALLSMGSTKISWKS